HMDNSMYVMDNYELLQECKSLIERFAPADQATSVLSRINHTIAAVEEDMEEEDMEEDDTPPYREKCDQCAALCINDLYCHEHGCPNERKVWNAEEGRYEREEPDNDIDDWWDSQWDGDLVDDEEEEDDDEIIPDKE